MDRHYEAMDIANPEHFGAMDIANPEHYYPALNYPVFDQSINDENWNYVARRTSQEIIPGLFLGPYSSAIKSAKESLEEKGITHIVCVRSACEARVIRTHHLDFCKYQIVELEDNVFQGIIPQLKLVIAFLDDCLQNGGRALVHGNAGMTRSATMVVGYVMWRYGVTAKQAFRYVQNIRFCINLSESFMTQLIDFENCIRAIHDVGRGPASGYNLNKRELEDGENIEQHPVKRFMESD